MIETKQCSACEAVAPFEQCCAMSEDILCARLAMYVDAKLLQTWQQKVRQLDAGHITTNADIQTAMQEQIDALNSYAARLSVEVSLLNGIITRAARDAQKYVDAAERSIDHD